MRLDQERQKKLEPERIASTSKILEDRGFEVSRDSTKVWFQWKGETVTFFPYSGWHSGKSIKDGRGFANLLRQLK